ncbi:response regulator transcription factor [Ramlibacter sp. G-1-2-2]|uniref:Response regulator transcription factor n=1 Tax=Ramlibacter agri TaxID=2728837 RepID=A0A848HJB0_9BURK|nr:response regulator transcription factor [Ramlibacter agri]NML47828.1 response regulator transcription factor [Ramlibacter agri]
MPTAALRVVLADDHDLVRSALQALLLSIPGVQVTGEARDGIELLALLESAPADLVLTDISMPRMDGIEATAQIRARFPGVKVLAVSMYDSADFVQRAVGAGACGYLMKQASPAELAEALRSIVATGSYFSAPVARLLMQPTERAADDDLTGRQLEVLKCIAGGLSAKEIAFRLGLSRKTVDVHRARIMDRLQVSDVASLTRYALRQGLIAQ